MPGSPTSITTLPRPANALSKALAQPLQLALAADEDAARQPVEGVRARVGVRGASGASGSTRSSAASTSVALDGAVGGDLRQQPRIISSRSGGQCSECHDGATGGVLMCWLMTAVGLSPANGGLPVTSS